MYETGIKVQMNRELTKKLARMLRERVLKKPVRIMEVCGTHTVQFFKTGVKDMFPEGLELIDGPGCPVCVTENSYLDLAITTAQKYDAIITTFGDMIKVPSSYSSLAKGKARGMDVRIIYSPMDALKIAGENPEREVIFLGVGFETTTPSEAITILEAEKKGLKNFSILSGNKATPPAVRAVLSAEEVKIDGFILPGHVSSIIGRAAWDFIPKQYGLPGVIAGFEAMDLITGVLTLLDLIENGDNKVINSYKTAVQENGNVNARDIMNRVYKSKDAEWRGLGTIPESGLFIREKFKDFDTAEKLPAIPPKVKEHKGCRCGDLLRGLILPPECPLFGEACSPGNAVGPCMVSGEGPCAAYYKYGRS